MVADGATGAAEPVAGLAVVARTGVGGVAAGRFTVEDGFAVGPAAAALAFVAAGFVAAPGFVALPAGAVLEPVAVDPTAVVRARVTLGFGFGGRLGRGIGARRRIGARGFVSHAPSLNALSQKRERASGAGDDDIRTPRSPSSAILRDDRGL